MSTTTTYYNLIKPELSDPSDITNTNSNWDTIDTALHGKQATITGGATTILSSNLTASRALISDSNGKVGTSEVTSTELGYLDGVTSNVQTQLNGKVPTSTTVNGKALSANITLTNTDVGAAAASHTHSTNDITGGVLPVSRGGTGSSTAATALTNLGLTATAAEINLLDGVTATTTEINKLSGLTPSTTELNYVKGVTSAIQTQINNANTNINTKVSKSGDSLTGMLTFNNTDSYHAFHKYRIINSSTYGVNVGCGVLGGAGVVSLECRDGADTTSSTLGRLEIGSLGVSYVDSTGKRTYLISTGVSSATVV